MKEYKSKGISVIIDGDELHIKVMWIKTNCTFSDITNVDFDPHAYKQGGTLTIHTTKLNVPCIISFKDHQKDDFSELYYIIKEKTASFFAERERQAERQAERARQLDEEGIAYCPKCMSTSLSLVQESISLRDVMCMKCGHRFNPRG